MSIAQVLHDRPIVGIAVAAVAIGLVLFVTLGRGSAQPTSGRWFYDLTSGDLVQVATADPPPITLDNGHAAVWAHVFSCGNCGDANQQFIGYLEKFSNEPVAPAAPVDPNSPLTPSDDDPFARSLIASPNDPDHWVAGMSPQAAMLRNSVMQNCPGGRPTPCRGSE